MKEKALSQENQKSSKDGTISTKVESTRQRFINPWSRRSSEDPGVEICRRLCFMLINLGIMEYSVYPYTYRELWILLTQDSETLKEHRKERSI